MLSIPTTIPTITVARVIRDGTIHTMPFTLLVEDDIILLAYGDTAPARAKHIPAPHSQHPVQPLELVQGQILAFESVQSNPDSIKSGFFYFQLLETPLIETLQSSLAFDRPETVIMWQIKKLRSFLVNRVIWVVVGVSFIVNLIRFVVGYSMHSWKADQAIELLLSLQVYVLILLLPLWLPTMCLVARSYGNAQILCLLDAIHTSKVQFEDKEDVDEFDAAPPPTKNIATAWSSIAEKFWDQLIRFDVDFLARTTGLIESLANTTVICAVDREGTISMVKRVIIIKKLVISIG